MTTAPDKTDFTASPADAPIEEPGRNAVLVPLILGGAVIAAVIILWYSHVQKNRLVDTARVEEQVRVDLRSAYRELRRLNPEGALAYAAAGYGKIESLRSSLSTDYADLKTASLMIEAEALFMIDRRKNAALVEERFNKALALMTHASGEIWQFGILGRARARFEQGNSGAAVKDLDLLLERNPNYGAGYYWRSLAKKEAGDGAGALKDEQTARNLDSWPPLRDFMIGSCERERDVLSVPWIIGR